MAATLRPAPRFSDENPTRHSFSLPQDPPSLDASSMKSRRSFLSLFTPTRRLPSAKTTAPAAGSKLKIETKPAETVTTTNVNKAETVGNRYVVHSHVHTIHFRLTPPCLDSEPTQASRRSNKSQIRQRYPSKPSQPLSVYTPLMRFWLRSKDLPRSKSHTILRAISTTFRTRPTGQTTPPPPVSPTPQAKQNREAALRERGLLPPLAPPRDLSRQEADLDRRTPIIRFEARTDGSIAEPSAADLVKREWESKNQSQDASPITETEERGRMKSFKFGAPLPQATQFPAARDLVVPAKVNSDASPPPPPMKDLPPKPSSRRSSGLSDGALVDAASVPLPSSPLPASPTTHSATSGRASGSISSANNRPPSSFHYVQHGENEVSSGSSLHSRSGSRRSFASALQPSLPSPQIVLSGEPTYPSLNISIPSRRSGSLTQLHSISESTSPVTPSLDSSSRTVTTISTLNTVESPTFVSSVAAGRAKGKMGMLKVKTSEPHSNIPMIIESPVENGLTVKPELELQVLPLSPITTSQSPTLMVPQQFFPTRRARGLVNPDAANKRRSFNPFKRSQPVGPTQCDHSRETKKSSTFALDKLKRASTNFSKPKLTPDAASNAPSSKSSKRKMLDVSHLPPSPTLPSHLLTAQAELRVNGKTTGVGQRPQARKAVAPTLHSRGSILLETSAIKDEESRRMTEMAFLG